MKTLFYILSVVLVFSGCKSQEKQNDHTQNKPAKTVELEDKDRPFMSIERTACFGACPTYKMTIYHSGKAEYHGEMNVKHIGDFRSQVSQSVMDDIVKNAKEISFMELENVYNDPNVTDLPSTIIYLHYDQQEKYVTARFNVPDNLQGFIVYLQKVVDSIDWQPVEEE